MNSASSQISRKAPQEQEGLFFQHNRHFTSTFPTRKHKSNCELRLPGKQAPSVEKMAAITACGEGEGKMGGIEERRRHHRSGE